jgi:hypothetical protein
MKIKAIEIAFLLGFSMGLLIGLGLLLSKV